MGAARRRARRATMAARSPASSIRCRRRMAVEPTRTVGAAWTWRSISRPPTSVIGECPGARAARHQPRHRHHRLDGARSRRCGKSVADAGVGIVVAPNFSTGVVLFEAIVAQAARLFAPQADSARSCTRRITRPRRTRRRARRCCSSGRWRRPGSRGRSTSRRRAPVHSRHPHVGFDGPAETITLTHAARDRTAFARGALTAAKWIQGKRGWFTMQDVLGAAGQSAARMQVAGLAGP